LATGSLHDLETKVATWLISDLAAAFSGDVGFANSVNQVMISVGDSVAAALEEGVNPAALVLGACSVVYGLTGLVMNRLAADPPDADFTETYVKQNLNFTIPGATTVDTAVLTDSSNLLQDELAMLSAAERYQGAELAGDSVSQSMQEAAFNAALVQSKADQQALSANLPAFLQELNSLGISDADLSVNSLSDVQSYLQTAGLSDPFLTNLIKAGLTQTEAQQAISDVEAEQAPALSGSAFSAIVQSGLDLSSILPPNPPVADFDGDNTSDILFRDNSTGDTWFEAMSNGAFNGWNQIGGSDTTYTIVGSGDFYGTGNSDPLFRNSSTGDTWFEVMSNGAFAGWQQIGGSSTSYSVVGVGDFFGNGTDDILFRNSSTGDTWIEAMSNGTFAGWSQIGGSGTNYSVVGVGDFFGNGTDDILFRNSSSGDTWIEAVSNGAFAGWNQIGGSNTGYSVVGVGDFYGTGYDDVLFRNNSTGDTWFEAMSHGAFAGWQQVGGSDTNYLVVGVGDYFGNGTDDILFRNNSTGDTWIEAMSNGASAGWNQVGGSNTSYTVKT
jgi:hypothetical protein